MPRRSCKRNKRITETPVVDEPVQPIKLITYKDMLSNTTTPIEPIIIEQPVTTSNTSQFNYATTLTHDQRIIHWERAWNDYINEIFYGMVPKLYHNPDCYNEFVEIAYLLTPFSFHKCRVAYPNDQAVIADAFLTESIPINWIKNRILNDGYCLLQDNFNPISISTSFSKYLYGIEEDYVPKFTDESDEDMSESDDVNYDIKVFNIKTPTLPAELLLTDYDSEPSTQ